MKCQLVKEERTADKCVFVQKTWPDSEGCRKSVSAGKPLERQNSDYAYTAKLLSQSILLRPSG